MQTVYNTIKRDETIFYHGKLQVIILLDRLLQRIFIINYNLCRLTHVKKRKNESDYYKTISNVKNLDVDLDHVLAPVEVDNLIYNPNLLKIFDTIGIYFFKYYINITIHTINRFIANSFIYFFILETIN